MTQETKAPFTKSTPVATPAVNTTAVKTPVVEKK
jgi:hypothetical protein